MAPALALFVKYEVYTQVVGSHFLSLPSWVHAWTAVDTHLLEILDINRDGIVQLAEISMGADVVVLAMPEIGGLPYVIRV
jgi:cation/acetate symporter